MIDDAARERYQRQLSLDGFGAAAQEKLAEASVFVAGAGGLGCSAAIYLAAAGIGRLRVADHGNVELGNLNRQILYGERDIGGHKVAAMARRIEELNANVSVEPLHVTLGDDNLYALAKGSSLLIDALDNLPSRYALNKVAIRLGVPIVHGAVQGFFGQVMTIVPNVTACLMCLYGGRVSSGAPPVIGVAPGVIGLLQATEAIKILTGIGRQLRGTLLLFDGLQTRITEVEISRDPACPHCGRGRGAAPVIAPARRPA
ncbi:MAG TPA: HesA/MoeB/ThiF family protein [Spirochaetia bacterium]|nr:HesA/MoeB/ThiF family protein [Spirochaetia bacterium]